ncbi:hypothetical protein [Pandoraea sp. NPDC090278]|uniref:hypothetical protein n=1 Tax=Pandoraea sp. NPDC090278 TaxID=3364391 RepID=UPI00383AFD79
MKVASPGKDEFQVFPLRGAMLRVRIYRIAPVETEFSTQCFLRLDTIGVKKAAWVCLRRDDGPTFSSLEDAVDNAYNFGVSRYERIIESQRTAGREESTKSVTLANSSLTRMASFLTKPSESSLGKSTDNPS